MTRPTFFRVMLLAGIASGQMSAAQDDVFEFFAQEAQVMTASLQPISLSDAPATVYVVTAQDIAASGGRTLWDALRGVPGVDVMTTRAWHGEVGIRGMNGPLNNRVLVLLNGKTVLNGFFDFVTWETIPVTLAEIERIEVVLGPASALHGANAVNGVINIITDPAAAGAASGEIAVAGGEHATRMGHAVIGGHSDDGAVWRASAGWRLGDQFEADRSSSDVVKAHGEWSRPLADSVELRLSAGIARHDTELATSGAAGAVFNDGDNGFLDAEIVGRRTQARAYWNRGRSTLRGFDRLSEPNTDYDTVDLSATRNLWSAGAHRAVAGASYRRNRMLSRIFGRRALTQDLWAVYAENVWTPRPTMNLAVSGRADWHPEAGWSFSPRTSLTAHVSPQHVVRLSAGTAFRNPTLTENFIAFVDRFPYDGNLGSELDVETIDLTFLGNRDLDSENLLFIEGSYTGHYGPLRASLAGFHYRLRDVITPGDVQRIEFDLPVIRVVSSFSNASAIKAWGGEAGGILELGRGLRGYANYSHLNFPGDINVGLIAVEGGPRHKVNAGGRLRRAGWLADLSVHWVSQTHWDSSPLPASPEPRLDSFHLVNTHLSRTLDGIGEGMRIGVDVFNLTDHRHAQLLPSQPDGGGGQFGEWLERRAVLSLTMKL